MRSWGSDLDAKNKLKTLTFNNLGLRPATVKLYNRPDYAEGNSWMDNNITPTGNLIFNIQNSGIFNAQIAITGDTLNTSFIDVNGQMIAVTAYPNPTKDVLELSFNNVENTLDVELIVSDMSGKNMLQKTVHFNAAETKTTLDLSGFSAGFYVVSIQHKGQILGMIRVSKL